MALTLLYKGPAERGECWQQAVNAALPEVRWFTWPEVPDPAAVDAILTWTLPDNYQQQYPNLKAIFSVGAGVDQFAPASLPSHLKLVRMIDPSIATQMQTWVLTAVMMLHRDIFRYQRQQHQNLWQPHSVKLPHECTISILGLGELGSQVAYTLSGLGFAMQGYSRSTKQLPGVLTFSGDTPSAEMLGNTNILISLLPLTANTKGNLNAELLAKLPKGAALINAGRGEQLVADDLLYHLDAGHISEAIMDVFDPEPLPKSHPFWDHPNIHITPHIASVTRNDTAALRLVENLQRWLANKTMTGEVDKLRGY